MAISNIDTTTDNGVKRITNTQTATGVSTIDGECVVLDDGDSRLETDNSNGQVLVDRTTIILDSDVTGNNNDNSVINYGGRAVTTTKMQFRQSVILINALSGRKNIQVTELSDTKVIEGDDTRRMFLYTGTNAIIKNVYIRGIQVWEIYRSPAELFNVIVDVCNMGYLNWEAGRIDLFGFDVINPATGHAWQGTGNSGNNHMWHWNNGLNFDNTKMYLTHDNNRYYEGHTIAWKFIDRRTGLPAENVKVKVKDDFSGNGASMTERGEFITNLDGLLVGTWDSKFRTSGSEIVRDVIYLVKNAVTRLGDNDTLDFPIDTINNEQGDRRANYTIDAIANEIEIKSYTHVSPDGHIDEDTFVIESEIGKLTSTGTVDVYQNFIMVSDLGITELDIAVPMAYTALETLDNVYDRIKAEWYNRDGLPPVSLIGVSLDSNIDIFVDGLIDNAYGYDSYFIYLGVNTGNKNLSVGTKVKEIDSDYVHFDNGATMDGLTFGDSTGVIIHKAIDLVGVNILNFLHGEISSTEIVYATPATTRTGDSASLSDYNNYDVTINVEITTGSDITTGQVIWEAGGAGLGMALTIQDGVFKVYVGEDDREYCNTFSVKANTKYQVSVDINSYHERIGLYIVKGDTPPIKRNLSASSTFIGTNWCGSNGTGVGSVNGTTRSPFTGDFLGVVTNNTINVYDVSFEYSYNKTVTEEDAEITLDNTTVDGWIINNNNNNTLTVYLTNGSTATTGNAGTGNGQVNIVSLVLIDINIKDSDGNNIVDALVYVDDDLGATGNIVNTTTDVDGNVTTSYSGGATNATIRVRKYGYKFSVGSISLSNNSQTNVVLITDPQQI